MVRLLMLFSAGVRVWYVIWRYGTLAGTDLLIRSVPTFLHLAKIVCKVCLLYVVCMRHIPALQIEWKVYLI